MPLEISISRDDLSPGYLFKPVDLNNGHWSGKPLAFRDRVNTVRTQDFDLLEILSKCNFFGISTLSLTCTHYLHSPSPQG